jgi:magnesium transporter
MPNEAELRAAQAAFGLPELAVADALRKHDRPKVERDDDCRLVVVPTAH